MFDSKLYRWIPDFLEHMAIRPLRKSDLAFDSDLHIANIDIPILIMHAADDLVVPYFLGVKVKPPGVNEFLNQSYTFYKVHTSQTFFFDPVVPSGGPETPGDSRPNIF